MTGSFVILGIIVFLSFGVISANAQENNTADFGISVETDEKLIENLTPILPYLGIIAVVIIVGIFAIIKKRIRTDDSDEEFEEDSVIDESISPKFQDIKTDAEPDDENTLDLEKIIQNKVRMISKLQSIKVGDPKKLESIKKSLTDDGSFTKAENDYLEELFEEYEKISDSKDNEN